MVHKQTIYVLYHVSVSDLDYIGFDEVKRLIVLDGIYMV
jgi:hypothetical protein